MAAMALRRLVFSCPRGWHLTWLVSHRVLSQPQPARQPRGLRMNTRHYMMILVTVARSHKVRKIYIYAGSEAGSLGDLLARAKVTNTVLSPPLLQVSSLTQASHWSRAALKAGSASGAYRSVSPPARPAGSPPPRPTTSRSAARCHAYASSRRTTTPLSRLLPRRLPLPRYHLRWRQ